MNCSEMLKTLILSLDALLSDMIGYHISKYFILF